MSAIMCRNGCATFRRERVTGYQQWENFPPSPELTSFLPYQCIVADEFQVTLVLAVDLIDYQVYYNGEKGFLSRYGSINICTLINGEWSQRSWYPYYHVDLWGDIVEANNPVYNNTFTTVLFAKTTTDEMDNGGYYVDKRITNASHLTLSAPNPQTWATYPDTPIAGYPCQVIFSAASYIRLIVNTAPWYYYFSGETQLKSAAVGKMYQLIGGVWEYLSDADNYSYTALLQANADVYDNATLTNVYFARTTAGGIGSERVRGAFYKKINSGVDRRQQWTNFPDSPVKTEDYPYQLLFESGYLYVSKGSLYVSNYVSRLNCTAETQLYTLTDGAWMLVWTFTPSDNWILYMTGIGGNDVQANQPVYYQDMITIWKNKDTTPEQDIGARNISRRIAL